jgi:hypothetical protein
MATYQSIPVPTVEGPQVVPISEMINTARGAQQLRIGEQAYQQAQQMNPLAVSTAQEQLKQNQIKSEVDQFGFQQKKFRQIADSQISMINDPLIVAAEENPDSVDKQKLKEIVYRNGIDIANAHGIKKEEANAFMQPYMRMVDENPGNLRTFYKQRLIQGADDATKIGAMQPTGTPVSTGRISYQIQPGEFGAKPRGSVIPGTVAVQQLAPGQQMKATGEVDINNNPIYDVMDGYGRVVGQTTVPSNVPANMLPGPPALPPGVPQPGPAQPGAAGGVTQMRQQLQPTSAVTPAANPNAIVRIPAGESPDTGKTYQAQAIESRGAVQPAKVGLQNIDTVLKYLPLAATGRYSEATAGLQSVLGNVAGSKPDEIAAAARNTITKTINDLAIQKNLALGGKFASSLEAAQSSLANAEMNPTAIAKSMEQLRPLLQNITNYSVGLDKAIEKSPVKQYVKPEFDKAFNDAFDMKALSFKSAFEQGKNLKEYAKENKISLVEQENLLNKIQAYDYLTNGDLAGYKAFMASLNRRR